MDSGLLTIRQDTPDILECGGSLDSRIDGSPRDPCNQGAAMGYRPAAALDLAKYSLQPRALRPGESAVAATGVEPDAQVSGKRCRKPPLRRFDLTAPLCRRTPKQSGIHKEPRGIG